MGFICLENDLHGLLSENKISIQGPVVQSILSLTSSLRGQLVKCFTTLLPKTMIFFVAKNERSFCSAKASHIFSTKNIG